MVGTRVTRHKSMQVERGSKWGHNEKCICDVFTFCDCRDNYGATPKDRLSKEEENYQEIVHLLDGKSKLVPQQQRGPALRKPTIQVSVNVFH